MEDSLNNDEKGGSLVTLVLRDPARSESIRALIRKEGGRAFSQSAFYFETLFDCAEAVDFLKNPSKCDLAIFVSPQGVMSMRALSMRKGIDLPKRMPCAGPGIATRKALQAAGFVNVTSPPGVSDLAELLRDSLMGRIAGKRVALIQRLNAAPRALFEIRKRKAIPVPIMCYQRLSNDEGLWTEIDPKLREDLNSIIAFDSPSLNVLLKRSGEDADRIKQMALGVIHPSIAEKAKEMGFENIIITGDSKDMILRLKKQVS